MIKNRSLVPSLIAIVLGMLMLTYASVPLYRLFCQVTGYGGTTREASHAPDKAFDRTITVKFNADIDPGLNWEFTPGEKIHTAKVGEQSLTFYVAHNRENRPVTGRAMYNVLPFKAGPYFTKIDCFCFTEQTLAAGVRVNMPISFYIDPGIMDDPDMKDVSTITLSYTFFEVKK